MHVDYFWRMLSWSHQERDIPGCHTLPLTENMPLIGVSRRYIEGWLNILFISCSTIMHKNKDVLKWIIKLSTWTTHLKRFHRSTHFSYKRQTIDMTKNIKKIMLGVYLAATITYFHYTILWSNLWALPFFITL